MAIKFFFMTSHAGNHRLSPSGDCPWFRVHQFRGSAQALNYLDSEGARSFSPVPPALKYSMSCCPFKVGPVGLAPTNIKQLWTIALCSTKNVWIPMSLTLIAYAAGDLRQAVPPGGGHLRKRLAD
jgi:hypothetical protein